jgi:hypothetical protein
MTRRTIACLAWLVPLALGWGACGGDVDEGDAEAAPEVATDAPAGVIDSILPMDAAIRRFRADVAEPAALDGPRTRDALVEQVVEALRANDTLAFVELAVDRAEWAWLYYPTALVAQPPYELPPGLAWFQLQEGNRKGVFRALREYGGTALTYDGYTCGPEPGVEGENRIWTGCRVVVGRPGETPHPIRLFASLIERAGHFAVLSYDNDF